VDAASIDEGQDANLVLFDIDEEWEYNKKNNKSKSYNSPFIGLNLKGKVVLTCNNNHLHKQ
jgi:dihydroorotase